MSNKVSLDKDRQCRYAVTPPFPCPHRTCSPAPGWSNIPTAWGAPRTLHHYLPENITLASTSASPLRLCGGRRAWYGLSLPGKDLAAPGLLCTLPWWLQALPHMQVLRTDALWHIVLLALWVPLITPPSGWQALQVSLESWLQVRTASVSMSAVSLLKTAHWQAKWFVFWKLGVVKTLAFWVSAAICCFRGALPKKAAPGQHWWLFRVLNSMKVI